MILCGENFIKFILQKSLFVVVEAEIQAARVHSSFQFSYGIIFYSSQSSSRDESVHTHVYRHITETHTHTYINMHT